MLLGDYFAYQIGWIDDAYWLLLLGAPLLLFIGYQVAELLHRRNRKTIPIVVLPPENSWESYTNDAKIVSDITEAVVRLRGSFGYKPGQTITYATLRGFLRSPQAHPIARTVPEFYVYRKDSI